MRGLLEEFSDRISDVLRFELSSFDTKQVKVLQTISRSEGEGQPEGQSASASVARPTGDTDGSPRGERSEGSKDREQGDPAAVGAGETAEIAAGEAVDASAKDVDDSEMRQNWSAAPVHHLGSLLHFDSEPKQSSELVGQLLSSDTVTPSEFTKRLQLVCGRKSSSDRVSSVMCLADTLTAKGKLSYSIGNAWKPDSGTRMAYEAFSILLLFVEGIMIPYTLAWDMKEEFSFETVSLFARIFWTTDLLLSFGTGYITKQHTTELRLHKTAKHFLATWFVFDATLVMWDWVGSILPNLRLMRAGRLVRIGRQLRRALDLVHKAKAIFDAKVVHLTIDISLLLVMFFWLAHVICCGWYALGKVVASSDTGATWLVDRDGRGAYSQVGADYEYTTALHWSLTQLTPASMEVVPMNTQERIFNIAVILGGFVVGSSLVATLSAMMTQYRLFLEDSQRKARQLRDYLDQELITQDLSRATKMQVVAILKQSRRIKATEVSYLSLLSNSMQRTLRTQVVLRYLSGHVFFGVWCQVDADSVATLCNSCVEDQYFMAGDICFRENQDGRSMFFVKHGALIYKPGAFAPEALLSEGDPRLTCKANSVASEVAMWLKWTHLGNMVSGATSSSGAATEVLAVNADAWIEYFSRHDVSGWAVRDYAVTFYRCMKEPDAILTDLTYSTDYHGLMFALPLNSRVVLSEALFDALSSTQSGAYVSESADPQAFPALKTRIPSATVAKLRDEVSAGKTCIGVVEQQLARFVFVVAIRVYRNPDPYAEGIDEALVEAVGSERFMVKVGEMSHSSGTISVSCVLPGSKRREQETASAAMQRVVDEDLEATGTVIAWTPKVGKSRARSFKDSPTYGIKTMYSRTLYTGIVREHVWPTTPAPCEAFAPKFSKGPGRVQCQCPRRSRNTPVQVVQREAARILKGIPDVAVCAKEDRRIFYAWLLDDEFAALERPDAKPMIFQWLEQIDLTHTVAMSM